MPINPMDLNELARIAASGILNSLPSGIAIALLAWSLSRVAGRDSSRTRFAIWFVALILVPVLPWAGSVGTSSRTVPAFAASAMLLPASFAYYLFGFWMLGATFGLARIAYGLFGLLRLKASCQPVDRAQLDPTLRTSLDEIQTRRAVSLCVSNNIRVPAAIGYFRPTVVFPAWALSQIAPQELNAILLHELAHLRRYDDWTNLGQKLLKALLFFHPAVWVIESRLTLEREMACDDAVLAARFNPRSYAESLVNLAEKSFLHHGVQLAQAAVGHARQLKLRVIAILRRGNDPDRVARLSRPELVVVTLAALLALHGISRTPRLFDFASASNQSFAAASAHGNMSRPELGGRFTKAAYSEAAAPSPVFLVVHSAQVRADGMLVRRVTVYRLTHEHQALISASVHSQI